MLRKKNKAGTIKKPFYKKWWFVLFVIVIFIIIFGKQNNSLKQSAQNTKNEESIVSKYKVGEPGLNGVVMTKSLIEYLSEAEKDPVKTKNEAESITKEIYNDVTNQDGTIMPEKEMMVKLYRAQLYYNKNNNSEYSSLNGLLIEEFGGRINKTRGAAGAAERMNNIKTIYNLIKNK